MRRRWTRAWFAAALAGSLLLGCERAAVKPSYPPDPLFLTKKPVAGKVDRAQPLLGYSEPAVPPLPPAALASAPRKAGPPVPGDQRAASPAPGLPTPDPATLQKTAALDPPSACGALPTVQAGIGSSR